MKILYGVPGEGMGHATRAKVILEHLITNHDIRIVSSGKAYLFLKKIFPNQTHQIKGFNFAYKDGVVSKSKTSTDIIKNLPESLIVNFKKCKDLQTDFKPDIIISDFESFTYFYAKYYKLPILSIDNMQILDRAILDIKIPESERVNYNIAKTVVKAKLPLCDQYLISTFFDAKLKKKNSVLVQPIIRTEILNAKRDTKNHILIYQSSCSQKKLIKLLNTLSNENFIVYGFNKEANHDNVTLKKFSEIDFIDHFRTAKAVFCNAGYSFISEALFLNKPICTVPIKNQFEQYLNGAYIQKLGYGKMLKDFELDGIRAFLNDLPVFSNNVKQFQQKDNNELFHILDDFLQAYDH
ncbi:MJ1255/VC2487 family glycosyltransferase [Aquimarina sp. 2201CG14-23]|uniref:MJ1255/VC2487 family glycosyltransferase n=1 Tax=Aquimarina mycalae TaxID=3040073 RepID=UPI0024781811|nr:MJ1255/VC2487 family glycosyltransferase [Aquimarina sp. 2201CG14-23]MDH7445576.1 glycosyltransferase family protein [Aquimarina sp. 2201CG14-23]